MPWETGIAREDRFLTTSRNFLHTSFLMPILTRLIVLARLHEIRVRDISTYLHRGANRTRWSPHVVDLCNLSFPVYYSYLFKNYRHDITLSFATTYISVIFMNSVHVRVRMAYQQFLTLKDRDDTSHLTNILIIKYFLIDRKMFKFYFPTFIMIIFYRGRVYMCQGVYRVSCGGQNFRNIPHA